MRTKPFHSPLEPYFDFILEARRKRQSWQEIADALTAKGVQITKQGVHVFMKRRLKWRYPLGMAPAGTTQPTRSPHAEKTHPDSAPLTENAPAEGEFTSDPLTRPLRKKSIWNKI